MAAAGTSHRTVPRALLQRERAARTGERVATTGEMVARTGEEIEMAGRTREERERVARTGERVAKTCGEHASLHASPNDTLTSARTVGRTGAWTASLTP